MSDLELDSEFELKRLIRTVTPLMSILTSDHRRQFRDRRPYYGDGYDQPAASYWARDGGYGGGDCCCGGGFDLWQLVALGLLSLLLFYLIFVATTTTTRSGRRKRNALGDALDDLEDDDDGIQTLFNVIFFLRFVGLDFYFPCYG